MKNYLTIREVSKKWEISTRRLQILCKQKRIEGAILVANMWFIPEAALKPSDERVKSGKYIKDKKSC